MKTVIDFNINKEIYKDSVLYEYLVKNNIEVQKYYYLKKGFKIMNFNTIQFFNQDGNNFVKNITVCRINCDIYKIPHYVKNHFLKCSTK